MSDPIPSAELQHLLSRMLDGELSADERRDLDHLLAESEAARQEYMDFVEVHAFLRKQLSPVILPGARPRSPDVAAAVGKSLRDSIEKSALLKAYYFFVQPTPFSMTVAGLVMVAVIAAMAFMTPPFFRAMTSRDEEGPSDAHRIVAELTGMNDATWDASADQLRHGDFLRPGRRVALAHGHVQVTYRDGAVVTIKGPAEYVVADLGRGELRFGRMLAEVPKSAIGFRVATPACEVEDQGTRFGLQVAESGASEVIVLEGAISVVRESTPRVVAERVQLVAGQGATVSARSGAIARLDSVDSITMSAYRELGDRNFNPPFVPIANASFESPKTENSTEVVAPWFAEQVGGSAHLGGFVINEGQTGMPDTPSGRQWLELISDVDAAGVVYQQIDSWAPHRGYRISMLVGNRDLLTDSDYAVELWVGGDAELAAGDTSLTTLGAVQVDTSSIVEIVGNGLIETQTFHLSTGEGHSLGDPVWLRLAQVARDGAFGDNDAVLFDHITASIEEPIGSTAPENRHGRSIDPPDEETE